MEPGGISVVAPGGCGAGAQCLALRAAAMLLFEAVGICMDIGTSVVSSCDWSYVQSVRGAGT